MDFLLIGTVVIALLAVTIVIARKLREIESVSLLDFLRRISSGAEFRDIEQPEL